MYYKLSFETWDYDFETEEVFFFKNKRDAEIKQERLSSWCTLSHRSDISEISFDQLKDEITVSEYEELFGTQINEPV